MGYSKEIYNLAKSTLDEVRNKNLKNAELRKKKFRQQSKLGAQIESKIRKTAIVAAKAVLAGKDVKDQLLALKDVNTKLQAKLLNILKEAGLPKDYLKVKYNCEKCLDTGYIGGRICACFKKILRNEAYNSLSRLSPLSLCSFSAFNLEYYSRDEGTSGSSIKSARTKMGQIYDFCKTYAKKFDAASSGNLLMFGEPGLGKTHLSLAIANFVINSGFGVVYVSVPNIIAKLERERFKYNTDGSENTEQYLAECDLLILDDLGTEYKTQFTSATLYNLINSRILYSRPTIISTNCPVKQLELDYSKRLVSRLLGNYKLLNFCGKDIRAIKASLNFSVNKN